MSYRPQWIFETPEGYRDEPWAQCLTGVTLGIIDPSPANATPVQYTTKGPFLISFDRDAEFWICSIAIDAPGNFRAVGIQIIDAYGFYIMDDFVGIDLYAVPMGQNPNRGGGYARTFNTPHYVPAGAVWQLTFNNFDNTHSALPNLELRGVKRFKMVCP
jgi:hypothetical protein